MNIKLVISSSFALRRLSSKYNYPLTLRLISCLYCIGEFNQTDKVCGVKELVNFYICNKKRLSHKQLYNVIEVLDQLGFISSFRLKELGKGYNLQLTSSGKNLVKEYNNLLSSTILQGLP